MVLGYISKNIPIFPFSVLYGLIQMKVIKTSPHSRGIKLFLCKKKYLCTYLIQNLSYLECFFTPSLPFLFLRQGLTMQSRLTWNSLCRPGWPQSQRFTCLYLLSAELKAYAIMPSLGMFRSVTESFLNINFWVFLIIS